MSSLLVSQMLSDFQQFARYCKLHAVSHLHIKNTVAHIVDVGRQFFFYSKKTNKQKINKHTSKH